jgi:HK97 family phage prohead protease
MTPLSRLVAPLLEVKTLNDGASMGTFEGYGSVFGVTDSYGDVVARGAFKKTLKQWKQERGKYPPMLLQHGGGGFLGVADDLVPVGVWDEMREDDTGLYVKGHLLALDTDRGKSIHAAMREGALDGLSIGFVTREAAYGKGPDDPARTIKAVDLWEVSVVTFPANTDARVTQVKGVDMTEREFEEWLTRQGGFSRAQAKAIVAKGFRQLTREAGQADQREAGTLSASDADDIIRRFYAA